jgi:hypothetical protein
MHDEGGTPASLDELQLEGKDYIELEKEALRLGTLHHVRDGGGRELFQIQRPRGQAAISEAVNFAMPRRRSLLGLAMTWGEGPRLSPGTTAEHALDRYYDMWTTDDRWLGRIEKDEGRAASRWTLILCEWQPAGWIDITALGYGPVQGQMTDATGRASLFLPPTPKGMPYVVVDALGALVAELQFGLHGWRDVLAIRLSQPVHPIYLVFFAVVLDYELNPSE